MTYLFRNFCCNFIIWISCKGDQECYSENGNLVQYDAFVLYAREDQEFVDRVVEKMEGEYGMKVQNQFLS